MAPALLIDGDVLCYRAGFATDKTKYLVTEDAEDGAGMCIVGYVSDAKRAKEVAAPIDRRAIWSRKESEPEDKALMLVDIMIGDIRDRFANEGLPVRVFISGVGNFRYSVASRASYKGNRSGSPQPTHMRAIRQHLIDKWQADVSHGEEADDRIGIEMTANPGSVVCSIDKDLKQLAGRHYDFTKKEEVVVSKKEAVINLYSQVLSGDATDNIPGITGVGPVKARKILADCKSPWECWYKALATYNAEFGAERGPIYAREAAQLVYVRRQPGEMWAPPTLSVNKEKAA